MGAQNFDFCFKIFLKWFSAPVSFSDGNLLTLRLFYSQKFRWEVGNGPPFMSPPATMPRCTSSLHSPQRLLVRPFCDHWLNWLILNIGMNLILCF